MSDTPRTDAIRRDAGMLKSITVNQIKELERENAALRAELAPLRETVGVAATASTCADDLSNWSKLVERADNSTRLERENAALREDNKRLDAAIASWDEERERALREANRVLEWQEKYEGLERENVALRSERDLIKRQHDFQFDKAVRLERENSALKIESNRYKIALQDIASSSTGWARERAKMQLRKEAQP